MKNAILNGVDGIKGGLIDSYVAGAYKDDLAEKYGIRVGTVFDHQFAYGFAASSSLNDNAFEKCMRRALSTKESEIIANIQKQMQALPVSTLNAYFSSNKALTKQSNIVCRNIGNFYLMDAVLQGWPVVVLIL